MINHTITLNLPELNNDAVIAIHKLLQTISLEFDIHYTKQLQTYFQASEFDDELPF